MSGKMLERVHSARRPAQFSGGEVGGDDENDGDESKTRKHISVAVRATNYLTRTGYLWPFLVLCLVLVLVSSLLIRSRSLVCVSSSYDPVSRMRFFGYDEPDSDFGSLGVSWCKYSLCDL